ncbi:MAG: hypothetical protein CMM84_03545 [Rhodothermaceae bacterium]|nr:hypothetical protein [Rhodothermaceae bacterium]MBC15292.1 hypothetical protein [Rhodothermaceae bacterium]
MPDLCTSDRPCGRPSCRRCDGVGRRPEPRRTVPVTDRERREANADLGAFLDRWQADRAAAA